MAFKAGQLTQETQMKLAADMQMAQMNAQLGNAAKTSEMKVKGSNEVAKVAEQNKGRAVETAMNVMQRAQSNLGGGAPSLPKTPKLSGQKQKK